MGVWGGLCVFDYNLYLKSVVPAFQCGESHPFIQQISAKLAQSGYEDARFQGLADVISHCNNSITTCNLAKEFQVVDGKVQLATKQNPAQWGYESFIRLFEWAVTTQCVSHYTIFGLSVSHLGRNLFPKVMEWDQLTLELIAQLDTRTQFWAHDSGGYGEGIQGWLDPEETELLALSLPALVPNTQQADAQNMLQKKVHTYHQIDGSKKPISHLEMLNRFGRLLQIAVDQGCGLLWGRDLDLFYEQSRRMMFAVPEQIPIEVLIEKPPQPVDPTPVPA
ncbi:MAG: hypothetical protein GY943_04040, partial [Chloroflexi bacterium]|nr:hypothetical protein [Chloroflexota bacterium]